MGGRLWRGARCKNLCPRTYVHVLTIVLALSVTTLTVTEQPATLCGLSDVGEKVCDQKFLRDFTASCRKMSPLEFVSSGKRLTPISPSLNKPCWSMRNCSKAYRCRLAKRDDADCLCPTVSVTSSRYHPAESVAATGCPGCRRECSTTTAPHCP